MVDTANPSLLPPDRLPAGAAIPRRAVLKLRDGYQTVAYVHDPAENGFTGGQARLPVLYLHGIQSHPAWFVASGAELARLGHPVYQVTRRGSGENSFARGDARSARQLLEDVAAACRFICDETRAGRVHLLGVSWGGKLLAAFAAETRDRPHFSQRKMGPVPSFGIASLTLVAPGIAPLVDIGPWTKLAVGASAFFSPRRLFDIPLGDPNLFTDNPPMRDYIGRDPLSLRRATAGFLLASHSLDRRVRRAPRGAISVPTTLILASRDRIIDSARAAEVVRRLTAGRCQVKELPGAHTLEFEPDPAPLHEALAAALVE